MTLTTTISSNKNNQDVIKNWLNNTVITPHRKRAVVTLSIASFTLVCISFLFSLFLVVSILDDFVQFISPHRIITFTRNRIDWTGFIDQISHQLTNFAEWEKQKRAAWKTEENYSMYNEDRFHDMIFAVTTYMNDYVHHRKQQTKQGI